ncbi:MAG: T9SS type A sorting domain-containing protein [Bacteroidales bacterium]|nr:T9SS type A sorting domain-containing protein [Bacteroidales bacterium]
MKKTIIIILSILLIALVQQGFGQFVQVGNGSYTTVFPGVDPAGRNTYPSGTPHLSGNAVGKPVPTNDWWSAVAKTGQASNLFNYPFTMKTTPQGLLVTYIPFGPIDDIQPVIVGVSGLSATTTKVSDYSDWTVTFDWNDGTRRFQATAGVGMPFLYFTKNQSDVARVTVNQGTVTVSNEMILVVDARNGADFAIYAPTGSTWTQTGNVYTSDLNGKNYWSLAFIPLTASNVAAVANEYKQYAYVFPVNTTANYSYNESTSVMRTDFEVETDIKEGANTNMLLGLLPHQWANLAADSPVPDRYSYAVIRGEMKTMAGNSFSVENTFNGVLPTMPYVDFYSEGFSPLELTEKVESLENSVMATWTDSYNEGQIFNQLLQTARIADLMGNLESRNKMLNTIKTRLEDWFKAEPGEVAFLFYYNSTWSAMIGYPAGHGQDGGLNDHHFHWGYFIQACAFVEQYEPGWAEGWGGMVNLLVRDAAAADRNDPMFPYLRNFNPYTGHSWADGFAIYPQGNNQESSSEAMVFASALINWGAAIGDDAIRDLGIYIYTTEYTGIEEYYMDMNHRNFPPTQQYALISRLWGNAYDNQTFWTGDIAASYGIEIYPIQGGSLYLGLNAAYALELWSEVAANTGILNNEPNPNLWHDEWWKFLAFIDPSQAIEMYNSYPDRQLKFGVSDAQTYHWVHAMNALGKVNAGITADYPIAAAFHLDGNTNYVANNYSGSPITVTFSDGYQLAVPARKMVTSLDCALTGVIATPFQQAYIGGSVELNLTVSGGTPTKVEFMDGANSIGIITSPPFNFNATNLQFGIHSFYAKIYDGDRFNITNMVKVQVGDQYPYGGTASTIPGVIQPGNYDFYIGGKGQNIAYFDATANNEGDYRTDESVDAFLDPNEGATVEYIISGEWLEYTVNVAQSGLYSLAFRYASNNSAGGGPFHLELDGQAITGPIAVTSTSGWDIWATKTVTGIPFTPGEHLLRVAFSNGEFNFGKMTFTRTGDLNFTYPIAHAGDDFKVVLPLNSATLDGSASTESGGNPLTFEWSQNYGPSVVIFSDPTAVNPTINGLVEGVYSFRLQVANPDLRTDFDDVLVMVTPFENTPPTVALISPANNAVFTEGKPVTITAMASDFDGTVQKVEFFANDVLISTITSAPYTYQWFPYEGDYVLVAKATDNEGAESTSQPVNITVDPLMLCSGTSTAASQGTFTDGYKWTYETVGTNVVIHFELFDNKIGVVAYLWKQNPFTEIPMTHVSGRLFVATISGQTIGETISYACKFAYQGGMSVTTYIQYVVGSNCTAVGVENPSASPLSFYPNPVTNELYFSNINDVAQISIYDLWGKLVLTKNNIATGEKLDVSMLGKGVYFIRVEDEFTIRTGKLVKQ